MKIHQMQLLAGPFSKMLSGTKNSELRLNDEKRQKIKVGEKIEFTNKSNLEHKILTEVTYLKTYSTFKDLFAGIKHNYPTWEEESFIKGMYEYYSPNDEGVAQLLSWMFNDSIRNAFFHSDYTLHNMQFRTPEGLFEITPTLMIPSMPLPN